MRVGGWLPAGGALRSALRCARDVRISVASGRDVHVLDLALWRRDRQAIFPQPLHMEHDGLPDLVFKFSHSGAGGNAARQVGDASRTAALCVFNGDCVAPMTA